MKTEIQIPLSELKPALQGLGKIVGRTRTLPVLGCLKVSLDASRQTITLQAHNLDEVATVRLPSQGSGSPGELLVPLDALSNIVKRCSNEQSICLVGAKSETKIQYGIAGSPAERPVDHIPVKEWPAVKAISESPIDLDQAFKQALKQALECASEDSSRYVLNGACLDTRNRDAHYIVGTDGRHLYCANSFLFGLPQSLIIPSHKFACWPGFINDGQWKLRMLPAVKAPEGSKASDEPPWLQIDSDRWTYIARAIDGEFPNWKQVVPIPTAKWTTITVEAPGMDAILEALPLMPGGDLQNEPVLLDIREKGLTLRAKGKDQATETRVPITEVRVVGHPVETTVNRSYLAKAIRFGLNTIQLEDSLSPLVFTKDGNTMVIMPLRPEGAEAPAAKNPPSPPENTSAATPSAVEAKQPTETPPERTERVTANNTTAGAGRGHLQSHAHDNGASEESRAGFKAALEQIDRIKAKLKDVMGDLTEAVSLLKTAEKEQKASQKDIEAARSKLRELQSVEI